MLTSGCCSWLAAMGNKSYLFPAWRIEHDGYIAEAAKDYRRARELFTEALVQLNSSEKYHIKAIQLRIEWLGDLIRIQITPVNLTSQVLQQYIGVYGMQNITLENDQLQMEIDNEKHSLIPLSQDTFAIDGDLTIRLRFVMNDEGVPCKIENCFIAGGKFPLDRTPQYHNLQNHIPDEYDSCREYTNERKEFERGFVA